MQRITWLQLQTKCNKSNMCWSKLGIGAAQAPKETPMQAKEGVLVPETMQIVAQLSANFIITSEMMFIYEETTEKPLKHIETLDVELTKILTKVLYKLQVSVT
jgi:hypothetical protein